MRTRFRPFLVLLTSLMLALASIAQSVPAAAEGFNGDVKIHQEPGETEPIVNNDPQVCSPFSIHGFNFDSSASGWWTITGWAPTAGNGTANGEWTAGATGEWTSGALTLADGHYKLEYDQTQPASSGHAKHKVFWVDCAPTTGTLSVTKYNDLDNDGQRDANEGVLSGWTFTAKDAAGAAVGTMTTDASGTATLADLVPGTYSLVETMKPGWTNTDPGGGTKTGLAVTAGQTTTATFGNHQTLALLLTSMCSVDPAVSREWRVRNPNAFDVPFTWEVYGTSQTGSGTALASSDVFFTTVTVSGPNTTKIYWNGGETVKASGGATCAPPTDGTLRLLKYNDLDNDGSRDLPNGTAGEPGLSGWSFTVQLLIEGTPSGDPQTITTGTDPLGEITLTLAHGQYRVCEVLPLSTGWSFTDPDTDTPCKDVNVSTNEQTTVSFGNHYTAPPQNGSLRVFKYNDADGNGSRDRQNETANEPGLGGWSFTVRALTGAPVGTIVTAGGQTPGAGELSLPAGTYEVCEDLPLATGWANTDPAGASPCKTVVVPSGESSAIAYFGNHYTYIPPPSPVGTLRVFKYEDLDADGTRDVGETGLSGWSFQVRAGTLILATLTTDALGFASITLAPGTYTVTEIPQAGWMSTEPGGTTLTQTATVVDGQVAGVIFGNAIVHLPPTSQTELDIVKYADANANGRRDAAEGTLAGFTFTVRSSDGAVVRTAVTGDNGVATILNLPLATYTVTEEPRAGWVNTDPGDNAQKTFTFTTATISVSMTFGNAQVRLPSTSTDESDTTGGTLMLVLLGAMTLTMATFVRRTSLQR